MTRDVEHVKAELAEVIAKDRTVTESIEAASSTRHDIRDRRRDLWIELRLAGVGVTEIAEMSGVAQPMVSKETAEFAKSLRAWTEAVEQVGAAT